MAAPSISHDDDSILYAYVRFCRIPLHAAIRSIVCNVYVYINVGREYFVFPSSRCARACFTFFRRGGFYVYYYYGYVCECLYIYVLVMYCAYPFYAYKHMNAKDACECDGILCVECVCMVYVKKDSKYYVGFQYVWHELCVIHFSLM